MRVERFQTWPTLTHACPEKGRPPSQEATPFTAACRVLFPQKSDCSRLLTFPGLFEDSTCTAPLVMLAFNRLPKSPELPQRT